MACPVPVMDFEQTYLQLLQSSRYYTARNDQLTVFNSDGIAGPRLRRRAEQPAPRPVGRGLVPRPAVDRQGAARGNGARRRLRHRQRRRVVRLQHVQRDVRDERQRRPHQPARHDAARLPAGRDGPGARVPGRPPGRLLHRLPGQHGPADRSPRPPGRRPGPSDAGTGSVGEPVGGAVRRGQRHAGSVRGAERHAGSDEDPGSDSNAGTDEDARRRRRRPHRARRPRRRPSRSSRRRPPATSSCRAARPSRSSPTRARGSRSRSHAELACRYFDPAEITVPADPTTLQTAVVATVTPTPYADAVAAATNPANWTVVRQGSSSAGGVADHLRRRDGADRCGRDPDRIEQPHLSRRRGNGRERLPADRQRDGRRGVRHERGRRHPDDARIDLHAGELTLVVPRRSTAPATGRGGGMLRRRGVAAGRRGRLADDQARGDDDVRRRRRGPTRSSIMSSRRLAEVAAHLDAGLADRRQRRDRERGDVDVVEADDRELVGDDDPGLERRLQQADRDRVGGGEDRRRAARPVEVGEQLAAQAVARLAGRAGS